MLAIFIKIVMDNLDEDCKQYFCVCSCIYIWRRHVEDMYIRISHMHLEQEVQLIINNINIKLALGIVGSR